MPRFNATPYVVAGGVVAAVLTGLWLLRRRPAQAGGPVPGGPVPVEIALAELIATGHINLVSQYNPTTNLWEAFVPNLGGGLEVIRPLWPIGVNLTQAHTVLSSGVSYFIPANTPTLVGVGATVSIRVVG